MSESAVALADCNNFYCSCERVFNAALWNRPVIVLSNNDGFVIARSEEAKALGIEAGELAFERWKFYEERGVQVYSSNYALYADLSLRVMRTLARFTPRLEVYSIDEAFLCMERVVPARREGYARRVRATVKQWTGIPISIGIAPTKTLAKLANSTAKRNPGYEGVLDFGTCSDLEELLGRTDVEKVWGIGSRRAAFLRKHGIETARQFRDADDAWIRKHLTVMGYRTALELRGIPCLPLALAPPPRKTMVCSRSFGRPVTTLADLKEAVACYASRAAEKLRAEGLVAGALHVFVGTNPFNDTPRYAASTHMDLALATNYTPTIAACAHRLLEKLYRPGFLYKSAGVMFTDLAPMGREQMSLFEPYESRKSQNALMEAMDALNRRFGKETLRLASSGFKRDWEMRRERMSPAFTTRWDELLTLPLEPEPPECEAGDFSADDREERDAPSRPEPTPKEVDPTRKPQLLTDSGEWERSFTGVGKDGEPR